MKYIKNRAFTLIELLVVIAIIAILAAILFPVFAQAKTAAKKTQVLSNTKQAATSLIIYTTDADDNFPSAYAIDQNTGTMIMGPAGGYALAVIPAGRPPFQATEQTDGVHWLNSTAPYTKNFDLNSSPFVNTYSDSSFPAIAGLPATSASMNGLLSLYSATAVSQSSRTPLISWGNGIEGYKGWAYTNPLLRCNVVGTAAAPAPVCRFNPGGPPQAGSANGATARQDTYEFTFNAANDTTWTSGDGMMISRVDTSAKFYQQPRVGTNTGNYNQIGYIYTLGRSGTNATGGGYLDTPLRCRAGAGGFFYQSFFRPDSEFNYGFGSTAMAKDCFVP
jgi:prepilin-type N-terminal cleavage/methylation domain-containing protein